MTSIEPAIILLVEDNPDHTELIIRTLNDHRIPNRIIHVTDGESALDYLCGAPNSPIQPLAPNRILCCSICNCRG